MNIFLLSLKILFLLHLQLLRPLNGSQIHEKHWSTLLKMDTKHITSNMYFLIHTVITDYLFMEHFDLSSGKFLHDFFSITNPWKNYQEQM